MEKMKAYARTNATNQEVKLIEVPIPEILPDEVLVKVEAFGVGIHDRYFIPTDVSFPYPIGSEGAGTIAKMGSNVTGFKKGDRVIFTTAMQPQGGCWAEYTAANQAVLIPLPEDLTFSQGAAIPIAGRTAIESMRALDLKKGDRLFIAGASGAIGTYVIQLAKAKGLHVSASASERNHEYMEALGAEKAVDYHAEDWQDQIKEWSDGGVTAALAIQPDTGIDSIKVVKDGGKLITVSGYDAQVPPERNITIEQMQHHSDTTPKVVDLVKAIGRDEVWVVIEKEYPFDRALDALEKVETRHARGKSVVSVSK